MSNVPVIAIDGPSGSGKGTLCQTLARHFGWHLLDSGALYRLTGMAADRHGIALDDELAVAELAKNLDVQFVPGESGEPTSVLLEGDDVSGELRTEKTGLLASKVAVLGAVRSALLQRQRDFAQTPGLVADGRDMGTVVFTDAPLKIFLTASAEERAERRYKQLKSKGDNVNLATLLLEIQARDKRDSERELAPLKPAADAIQLDSSGLGIEEVFERVLAEAKIRQLGL
ncbi:cytidylate kinase [gamma proteobacterium BDW918]|jgi:cytidylate kinase|uniref:Cytidylate kinase n=1 Tax=Zhongshania aliphaticivorans TaxID=1470434 RepID=A0A127M402_9GAMM|nr:(d)CMP kinase [Zhongshania aliphaticivorans]AMO67984.1 cytidylate kinase [Zhongshania aliphaticivorans]EIF44434.1 cytidylate kinase [gamma proteobacterium BDW918]|tara:strand:- start:212 stop:898 length:687 start_codon:yes stop_codon:yes gene_type:complete